MQSTLFPLQGHFGEKVASPLVVGLVGGVVISNGLDSRGSFSPPPLPPVFLLLCPLFSPAALSAFFGPIASLQLHSPPGRCLFFFFFLTTQTSMPSLLFWPSNLFPSGELHSALGLLVYPLFLPMSYQ